MTDTNGQYRYNIIAVDDEPGILNSLRRVFHNEPVTYNCATSGLEALEMLQDLHDVAVIISDQRMPQMNGAEFLARASILAPDAIKILLTAYSDFESTINAVNEGGATHFLLKPWNDAQLLQIVREAVSFYDAKRQNIRNQEIIKAQNIQLTEMLKDLSDKNAALERLAVTDPLTNLYNRRCLYETLDAEISRIQRYGGNLSILLYDIDHFKQVNDTWGHDAGDAVLQTVAAVTSKFLRSTDFASRYGGEEFVLLLRETDMPEAKKTAERLRQLIAEAVTKLASNTCIQVTVSIGVAWFQKDFTKDIVLKHADEAMYMAKETGRNRVVVYE